MTLSAEDYVAHHSTLSEMGQTGGQESLLKELGTMLFQRLFPDSIRQLYRQCLNDIRIRLIISPPELGWFHWEYVYDPEKRIFPGRTRGMALVRHTPMLRRITPLQVEGPLRILVMIASPSDMPALNTSKESAFIQKELGPLVQRQWAEITVLAEHQVTRYTKDGSHVETHDSRVATSAGLQKMLRNEYHVFHFIGHGLLDKQTETGVLALEHEETGRQQRLNAEVLRDLFYNSSVYLVVLNGCETAASSKRQPFLGLAPALVDAGIPAVVAMQFRISDTTAITFSREFYGALADGYPVDAATVEGRVGIYRTFPTRRDWGIPVLFMRSSDGVLWQIEKQQERFKKEEDIPKQDDMPESGQLLPEGRIRNVSVALRRELMDFFTAIPQIAAPGTAHAIIENAGLDAQLRNMIYFSGPPAQFFTLLLTTLIQYGRLEDGRHALIAVLESAKDFAGPDQRASCDKLIHTLRTVPE
jgi:hypothetical protein